MAPPNPPRTNRVQLYNAKGEPIDAQGRRVDGFGRRLEGRIDKATVDLPFDKFPSVIIAYPLLRFIVPN